MSTDPNEAKQAGIANSGGPDLKQARTRSVDNLQRLYTFVVSLAFAESLRRAFLTTTNNVDLSTSHSVKWMMCGALIITAIPFYHGANRYLDATYVTGERTSNTRFSLMIDFLFVFLQALLMFTLALLITTGDYPVDETNHRLFYWGLALLLSIDILWIFITRYTTKDDPSPPKQVRFRRWAIINIVTVIIILVFVYLAMWKGLLLLLIGRSVVDYLIAHDFYYPPIR
jgi:hypothetical protein